MLFIIYTYAGYPLILIIHEIFVHKGTLKSYGEPKISVVIAVHNEESKILRRIDNLFAQKYPRDKFDIIVVSDGSTDQTVPILNQAGYSNLNVIEISQNVGKALALNYGVERATAEIIVFADARQTFAPDVLRELVANFSDPLVGCVSGELILLQNAESQIQAEMGGYWKYEKLIRKAESVTGSVIGATGAIYAIRKALYLPLPAGTLLDDVIIPMNIVMAGYRTVFDGAAVAYDVTSKDFSQEWKRKVRTLAGNWQLLSIAPKLINPWMNPYWWRFLSHKLFRVIVPFVLFALFIAGALAEAKIYFIITIAETTFYLLMLLTLFFPALRTNKLINLGYFFMVMNAAAVAGFWRWITGQSSASWKRAYAADGNPE